MNIKSRRHRSSSKKHKLFFLIFCLIIFINPFPLGSNRVWAWSFEAILASSLLLMMVVCSQFSNDCISWHRIRKMKLEISLIGVWLLVNVLYLIPLHVDLLSILSPNVALAYSDLNLKYGYLSLDVYASYQTLMLSIYYSMIFVLGVVLVNSRNRVKFVLAIFLFLGVFESVYGMYLVSIGQTGTLVQVTTVTTMNASGTFVNKNHLVAFLSMCFILGVALRKMLFTKDIENSQVSKRISIIRYISSPARLIDVCLFLILAGIWNTHSRAGLGSFLLAIMFFTILVFVTNKAKSFNYKIVVSTLMLAIIMLIFVADDVNYLLKSLGVYSENGMEHIVNSGQGRLLAVNQVIENYSKYWFSGVGPGSYQVFFVNNRLLEQAYYFDHAHNDYIEFSIEYGLFSLILLLLLLLFLYRIFIFLFKIDGSFYKILAISVICCIIYMLFHGSMDFNARIPANAVAIIVVISMVYGKIIMSNVNKK